jgi:hypothetical protein
MSSRPFAHPLRYFLNSRVSSALDQILTASEDALSEPAELVDALMGPKPAIPTLGVPVNAGKIYSYRSGSNRLQWAVQWPIHGDSKLLKYQPTQRPLSAPRAHVVYDASALIATGYEPLATIIDDTEKWCNAHLDGLHAEVDELWSEARSYLIGAAVERRRALNGLGQEVRA